MSTRANIIVTDSFGDKLWFYRHSDGYPSGAMPTLEKFLRYVKENRIRDNAQQAAGWLVVLGREEYQESESDYAKFSGEPRKGEKSSFGNFGGPDWKVGAIEPTTGIHGDIEYLYTIDLSKKTITVARPDGSPVTEEE